MDMHYYFTPLFEDPNGSTMPGSAESGTLGPCALTFHTKALEYDTNMGRVVVEAPASWTPPSDWSQVDAALIEMDYPGLLGG